MTNVRRFLNFDPPAIAQLINDCCEIEANVSTNLLEFAVFAKTYFSSDRFFVATLAEQPVGFVHLGSPATDCHETNTLTISNFLVKDCDRSIASALLDHARAFAQDLGFSKLRIGSTPDNAEYYNGISTHFLNVGIPSTQPILPVLYELGFQQVASWLCLQFDPNDKQIPFSREQMELRRSHTLTQDADPDFDSIKLNSIYSHLATSQISLTNRSTGAIDAQLVYACLAQSYPDWPNGGIDLLRYVSNSSFSPEHYEFLLCETLRQLPSSGLSPLRIHIDTADILALNTALDVGFQPAITSVHVEFQLAQQS